MSLSNTERPPWLAILLWGVRTHASIIVVCALGLGLALPFLTAIDPSYQAEALVVARQLQMNPRALPSFAQAIFESDAMAQRIAMDGLSAEVLADSLDVVAAEDSIVLVVRGRADNPLVAARLADVAAGAFVSELNRGSGIGTFAVQSPATLPTQVTTEGAPVSLTGSAGAATGALLGMGLIALLAAVRRPVLQPSDASSAAGQPVISTVIMPAPRGGPAPDPHALPGLAQLSRALLPLSGEKVVLASSEQDAIVRRRLLVMLTLTLAPLRRISVTGPWRLHAAIKESLSIHGAAGPPRQPGAGLEIVDGVEPLDPLQAAHWTGRVVLVVSYGAPAAMVRRLAANFLDDEILGVVVVDERGALLWPPTSRRARRKVPVAIAPRPTTHAEATRAKAPELTARDKA